MLLEFTPVKDAGYLTEGLCGVDSVDLPLLSVLLAFASLGLGSPTHTDTFPEDNEDQDNAEGDYGSSHDDPVVLDNAKYGADYKLQTITIAPACPKEILNVVPYHKR